MSYSEFLKSRKKKAKELIEKLLKIYPYASILGSHIDGFTINVSNSSTFVGDYVEAECGFVIKVYQNKSYSEYSVSDILDVDDVFNHIVLETKLQDNLLERQVEIDVLADEKMEKVFSREDTSRSYETEELVDIVTDFKNQAMETSSSTILATCNLSRFELSKMFISKNKDLEQYYTWSNGAIYVVNREADKIGFGRGFAGSGNLEELINHLPSVLKDARVMAENIINAKQVTPGIYDCICSPSISGLIAHEAFGHGVEMDMFVKNRALAKKYMNEYVASPLVNMHDGAKSCVNVASYFFDDDGILAQDTLIIEKGILKAGISDSLSALELNTVPTGNSRRESFERKAYTRMTNTFFEGGASSLEDMIKSIKHGYILYQTDNGMEDPKNWAIQCVASYGREIIDGKLTDNYVAPVVMSGYVPDLLKSISAVANDLFIDGAGHCGKGYKEWVRVCDGGPSLKVRVKLG